MAAAYRTRKLIVFQTKRGLGANWDNSPEADPDGLEEEFAARPKTRGDCVNGPRPCPWASCKHHLYTEVNGQGSLSIPEGVELDEMPETCSLDVADKGPQEGAYVGSLLGMTKQRVEQMEKRAYKDAIKEFDDNPFID